jgi:hypothetical protein
LLQKNWACLAREPDEKQANITTASQLNATGDLRKD